MSTVVVGDGPAGAAAAAVVARRGESAWLVGRGRNHREGTLELLSARATDSLRSLDWYDAVISRSLPCDAIISRWSDGSYVGRLEILEPRGLGWIVDRAWFDPLLRWLAARDGVVPVAHRPEAPTDHRLVLATGKHAPSSKARRPLGPDLVALTATLPAGSVSGLAARLLVEAVDDGWWSALDDRRLLAVTFTTDLAHFSGGKDAVRRLWARSVAYGPGWLPAATAKAAPRVRPVRSRLSLDAAGADLRVGDAALSVDPLSGHGLTIAFESAMRCSDSDYPLWLNEQADGHERAGRAAYEAVPYASPFWGPFQARLGSDA